jgi:hypothetical protein
MEELAMSATRMEAMFARLLILCAAVLLALNWLEAAPPAQWILPALFGVVGVLWLIANRRQPQE